MALKNGFDRITELNGLGRVEVTAHPIRKDRMHQTRKKYKAHRSAEQQLTSQRPAHWR